MLFRDMAGRKVNFSIRSVGKISRFLLLFFFFSTRLDIGKTIEILREGRGGEGKNDFRREFFGLEGGWREAQARQRYSISSYPPLLPVYFSGSTSPIGEFPSPPIFPPPEEEKANCLSDLTLIVEKESREKKNPCFDLAVSIPFLPPYFPEWTRSSSSPRIKATR